MNMIVDIKSLQVVTLCFLEQNQHFTSSFSRTCPAFIVFTVFFFFCFFFRFDSCDAMISAIGLKL